VRDDMISKNTRCDVCGKSGAKDCCTCFGCGRVSCRLCSSPWDSNPFIMNDLPASYTHVCIHCDTLSKAYISEALGACEDTKERIESLHMDWVEHCEKSLSQRKR